MIINKRYEVRMEIAGPSAIFTRPDTGAAFVSYPAPTYSAVKGMFDSIARLKSAYIRPERVEICRPVVFHRYTTNYGGPLRKPKDAGGPNSWQTHAVILVDVCYRIYGIVEQVCPSPTGTNHLHALQAMFDRRLAAGQCYSRPCLGWREFVPTYVGPFRLHTRVETNINLEIPSMLREVFNKPVDGEYNPRFVPCSIRNGVLTYVE